MKSKTQKNPEWVSVVVLGDIGHSPRMNYHALSLADEGYHVNLVGYKGSKLQEQILSHPNISVVPIQPSPRCMDSLPSLLRLAFRVMWQVVTLWWSLCLSKRPQCLLLQNPPCVPALPVCWLYCLLFRSRLLLDWHNYGYTILSLSLGATHPLVYIYKAIERTFGKLAFAGICVSKAMKNDLNKNWGINPITVHYDRPPTRFHPTSVEDKHDLFLKLSTSLPSLSGSIPDKTVFTERFADGRVCFSEDRPALLISSTSWTKDEDFSVLLQALSLYDEKAVASAKNFPRLIVIVTGKGPLKEHYLELASQCEWEKVVLETVWLDPDDYPRLLAAADMGVCLHTSSSGLDLPMKVVDMFGCGLPVFAQHYGTLDELLQHNINGITFNTSDELADRLVSWFNGFPFSETHKERLEKFKKNLAQFRTMEWHESWTCNVLPLINPQNLLIDIDQN